MQTQEIAPHLAEITRALGSKVGKEISEEELHDEFAKYLEYGVPPDQAKKVLLRHYGAPAAPSEPPSSEPKELAQLAGAQPYVNLRVRFLTFNTKVVKARGEEKEIIWGLLGDGSGTAPYTSWRLLEGLAAGDAVAVEGAYTKEFNGSTQVNFGDRTRFQKLDPDEVPRPPKETTTATVGELREGMRGVEVSGRILGIETREVTVQGQPKQLWSGTLADASGKVEFTAWHDHGLEAGQAITIRDAYVRAFRGIPQLTFDENSKVMPYEGELPDTESLDASTTMMLGELIERGGGRDVTVVATLLEVRPGSGLILRCPQDGCSRVIQGGACRIHGKGTGVPDLRVKAILDDGTGAVNLVAGRELTESLLGQDLESAAKEAKDAFRPDAIQEKLEEILTGRVFRVRGNAVADDYGPMLIARTIEADDTDARAEAARLGGA